jgi:uracil-DNA glycosylase
LWRLGGVTSIFGVEHGGCFERFCFLHSGVLLLNAVLTVRAHSATSHKDQGWEQLTDAVVKHISDNSRNVVFLLWGSYAQKKVAAVDKVLVYIWSWKVHVFSDVLCGMGILL